MDIADKQNADAVRRILNALGTDRGLSDDTGVIHPAHDTIVMQSAWFGPRDQKWLVETVITVKTRRVQVNGMPE